MGYTSPVNYRPTSIHVTPLSYESVGAHLTSSFSTAIGSGSWPSANLALFFPVQLAEPVTFVKAFVYHGAGSSGNVDIGLYDEGGARLVSTGSTAAGSNVQTIELTDTTVTGPGRYYLAMAADATSISLLRSGQAAAMVMSAGALQMASAFALPTTATFATTAQAYVPVFGLSLRTVI